MTPESRVPVDRLAGWLLVAAGAVLVIVGAVQVQGADYLADQLSYLASAGIGGLTCVAIGGMLLLRSGLRDGWDKLDRVEDALRTGDAHELVVESTSASPGYETEVGIDLMDPREVAR